MKKLFLTLLLLLTVVLFFLFLKQRNSSKKVIMVGGKEVELIGIARTETQRKQGLSDRKSLCPDCGLLFVFDASTTCRSASTLSECRKVDQPGIYPFWMKKMYFDIDILWILGDRVVDITEGAKKPSEEEFEKPKTIYTPKSPVDKVLEVNDGWARENDISIGDKVELF